MIDVKYHSSSSDSICFQFLQKTKYILPHAARLCLVSTFIEDGIRMWMQWSEQQQYIMRSWNVGGFLGTMFVIINLLGQLIPCGMILARKKTDIACGVLVFIIAFQVRVSIETMR